MKKALLISALAACTLITNGWFAPAAYAGNVPRNNCTVTSVSFQQYGSGANNGPTLTFTCASDAATYGVFVGAPDCGFFAAPGIDTLKSWHSILQTALLSGRPVDFQKDTSCSFTTYSARLVAYVTIK